MKINIDTIHPLSALEWEHAMPYRTNEVLASGRIFFKQCKLGNGDTGYVGGVASEQDHEAYAMCQEAEKAALAFLSGDSDHGILKAPRYAKFAKLESYYKQGNDMYGFRVILQERYTMFLTLNVHKYELSIFIHDKAAWEKWVVACKDGFWVKDRHGKQLFRIRNYDELAVTVDSKVSNLPGNCYYWDEDHICLNHKVYTWAELEDYATRAAVNHFGWGYKIHTLIPMRRNLPDGTYHLINGKIAYIRKGGSYEYIPWSYHHCLTVNGRMEFVEKRNAAHATPAQIEAMSVGCWRGWDDPKADPAYCRC